MPSVEVHIVKSSAPQPGVAEPAFRRSTAVAKDVEWRIPVALDIDSPNSRSAERRCSANAGWRRAEDLTM